MVLVQYYLASAAPLSRSTQAFRFIHRHNTFDPEGVVGFCGSMLFYKRVTPLGSFVLFGLIIDFNFQMNVGMATNHEKFSQQRIPLGSVVLYGFIVYHVFNQENI